MKSNNLKKVSILAVTFIFIVLISVLLKSCVQPELDGVMQSALPFKEVEEKNFNEDEFFIDSCFRWLEKRPVGGTVRFAAKNYYLTKDIVLPQMINNIERKKFIVNMNGAKIMGGSLIDTARSWQLIHDINTFRSFYIEHGEFNGIKSGLKIQGAQMSNFNNIVFAGCKTGGYFGLCLQSQFSSIEENQCIDTGVYIGLAQGIGCTPYNSQSNNVTINMYRSFGAGTANSLIFDRVSGCVLNNITNEGKGCKTFLTVNAKGSNWVKSFYANDIHVEAQNTNAVIVANLDGYGKFYFNNIYAQRGNVLINGSGTGTIVVQNITYMPIVSGDAVQGLKFKTTGASDPLWWRFENCTRYAGKPFADNFYWVGVTPKPFTAGQTYSNSGDKRLYEIVDTKE